MSAIIERLEKAVSTASNTKGWVGYKSSLFEDALEEIQSLREVVEGLANWSRKYPTTKIYSMSQMAEIDSRLEELENKAKELIPEQEQVK